MTAKGTQNSLKITGGIYGGRRITTPGGPTHPMGERERLALFNMLTNTLAGARVLDAFAGSGALGIEALSRGAKEVVFIEKNSVAVKTIKENLLLLGISDASVIYGDITESISSLGIFDLILADPPYDNYELSLITPLISLLDSGGILVLSHPDLAPELSGLKLVKDKRYAGAGISIYTKN